MLTEDEIIRKIEFHREAIRGFGVKKIVLIGSYAAGRASKESDIDFLVYFQKGRGLFDDFVHLHQYLRDLFKREIDLGEEGLLREELKEAILGGKRLEAKI